MILYAWPSRPISLNQVLIVYIIKYSKLILLIIQLKVFYINHSREQEGLYNKVNNIAKIVDALVVYLLIQVNYIL